MRMQPSQYSQAMHGGVAHPAVPETCQQPWLALRRPSPRPHTPPPPGKDFAYAGCVSLPRVLHLGPGGRLHQAPLPELDRLRAGCTGALGAGCRMCALAAGQQLLRGWVRPARLC
jgi:hypothetical protein